MPGPGGTARVWRTDRLATQTSAEWFTRLNRVGVPCGPINTVDAGIALARVGYAIHITESPTGVEAP